VQLPHTFACLPACHNGSAEHVKRSKGCPYAVKPRALDTDIDEPLPTFIMYGQTSSRGKWLVCGQCFAELSAVLRSFKTKRA
jgi:hypothetical protein